MAEKNIVENRPAEDIKERFSSNETVNTVMNGLGKVVDYPMRVVGNLTVKNNAVDASVKPGKALGQSMLMGIVAFGLSLLLGNGLLGSLGFGLGAGIMGQEIRTMGGNLVDTIKGRESFLSGRFLSTAIPLLVSMVLSSKLGPGKALLTTVLGGALGSKVSNYFMGSNEGERYYGEDYVGVRKVPGDQKKPEVKENEVRDQSAKEVEKAWQTRPEIGNEKHGIVNEVRNDSVDLKAEIAATRDSLQTGKTLVPADTIQTQQRNSSVKL